MTKAELAELAAALLKALQVCQPDNMTMRQSNCINDAIALLSPELRSQWFDYGTFSPSQLTQPTTAKMIRDNTRKLFK